MAVMETKPDSRVRGDIYKHCFPIQTNNQEVQKEKGDK